MHIVDMHQLTKDPEIVLRGAHADRVVTAAASRAASSWPATWTTAARCFRSPARSRRCTCNTFDDPVVLSAVTEVETLATGISGKIWQKIVILDTVGRAEGAA